MKKRYLILGLSMLLALALAVPALGGPSNPVAHTASALSKAKKAIRLANGAQSTANSAQSAASGAQSTANQAKTAAAAAQTAAGAAQTAADAANANANTRIQNAVERVGSVNGPDTNTSKGASASCNSGEVLLGGGFFLGGSSDQVTVDSNEINVYSGDWFADGNAISGTPSWSITAIAMCGQK